MTNNFNEPVVYDDVKFACYIIERLSRQLNQSNNYIIKKLSTEGITYLLDNASVLHSQNPDETCYDLIQDYDLKQGNNIKSIDGPSDIYMGRFYSSLIWDIDHDHLVDCIIDVYNNPICEIIDDYQTSAHYEPLPVVVRAYYDKSF